MADNLSTRQKVAMAAALGAGVVVGASGIVVYQRLSQVASSTVAYSSLVPLTVNLIRNTHMRSIRRSLKLVWKIVAL